MVAMRGQALLARKGHRGDVSVAEPLELVAHGDQVLLAGQSHQVAMEDQYHRVPAMIRQHPGAPFVVERSEVLDRLALVHGDQGNPDRECGLVVSPAATDSSHSVDCHRPRSDWWTCLPPTLQLRLLAGGAMSPFVTDARIRQIARGQLGLITYRQATEVGVDEHALARRRATGALVELFPGVMLVDPVTPSIAQRILAAGLAVPDSIVTGPSSAVLHGFPILLSEADPAAHCPVLSIDRSRIVRLTGIRTLRQSLPPRNRPWVSIRVATPAATLLSLPRYVAPANLERCLDHAITSRLVTVRALSEQLEALPAARFVGRANLRQLLLERSEGVGHHSGLEQKVARWLGELGINGWRRNFRVDVGQGQRVEVDFAWAGPRVVLEVSPFYTHDSKRTQERDAERRRLLVEAAWRIIEATDRDLVNASTFGRVVASLRRALSK